MQEFKQAHTILFYISFKNEVFTHDMIKESMTLGKRIIVPITDKKHKIKPEIKKAHFKENTP